MRELRHAVFWPPFILLLVALACSVYFPARFIELLNELNDWILNYFAGLFSAVTLVMLALCVITVFSPLGNMVIGGTGAEPILTKWRWFTIILCTTIATGILFWGTAEPMYHLSAPPEFSSIMPLSPEAGEFSMSVMFLHWSFSPYAIYTVPALAFAVAYYNFKMPFSLGAMLGPLLGYRTSVHLNRFIDAICLYALVAGMAASLGSGILSLSGGLQRLGDLPDENWVLALICVIIVISFVASAASGLLKGIRFLSNVNTIIFLCLAAIALIFGSTLEIFSWAARGLIAYVSNFPELSLSSVIYSDQEWPKSWSAFYFANWMAWAPITALFLGRIAYGYTVRQFVLFNWLIPSLFAIVWMSIFSGSAIEITLSGIADLPALLKHKGAEAILYRVLDELPMAGLLTAAFVFSTFLSYVTAADSNTEAMSGISTKGLSAEVQSVPLLPKILWGIAIGLTALVMVTYADIDGIKMLSNLGGLPALFFLIFVNLSFSWILLKSFTK